MPNEISSRRAAPQQPRRTPPIPPTESQAEGLQRRSVSVMSWVTGAPMGFDLVAGLQPIGRGLAAGLRPVGRGLVSAFTAVAQGFKSLGQRIRSVGSQAWFRRGPADSPALAQCRAIILGSTGVPRLEKVDGPVPAAGVFAGDLGRGLTVFVENAPPRIGAPVPEHRIIRLPMSPLREDRPLQASDFATEVSVGDDMTVLRSPVYQAQRSLLEALGGQENAALFGAITQAIHQGMFAGVEVALTDAASPVPTRLASGELAPSAQKVMPMFDRSFSTDDRRYQFGVCRDPENPTVAYVRAICEVSNINRGMTQDGQVVDLDPARSAYRGEFILRVDPASGKSPPWTLVNDQVKLEGALHYAMPESERPAFTPLSKDMASSFIEEGLAQPTRLGRHGAEVPKNPCQPAEKPFRKFPLVHQSILKDMGRSEYFVGARDAKSGDRSNELFATAMARFDKDPAFDALPNRDEARRAAARREVMSAIQDELGADDDFLLQAVTDFAQQGSLVPVIAAQTMTGTACGTIGGAKIAVPQGAAIGQPACFAEQTLWNIRRDPASVDEAPTALVHLRYARTGFAHVRRLAVGEIFERSQTIYVDPRTSRDTYEVTVRVGYRLKKMEGGQPDQLEFTHEVIDQAFDQHMDVVSMGSVQP